MADRENVIKALELCTSKIETRTQVPCEACSYHNTKYHGVLGDGCCNIRSLLRDCLALLKAQEPRLMTLEEIQYTDAVWLETHGWVDGDVFETVLRRRSDFEDYVTEFATNDDCDITCVNSKIGIEWRCWTSRPDQATREAIPWE